MFPIINETKRYVLALRRRRSTRSPPPPQRSSADSDARHKHRNGNRNRRLAAGLSAAAVPRALTAPPRGPRCQRTAQVLGSNDRGINTRWRRHDRRRRRRHRCGWGDERCGECGCVAIHEPADGDDEVDGSTWAAWPAASDFRMRSQRSGRHLHTCHTLAEQPHNHSERTCAPRAMRMVADGVILGGRPTVAPGLRPRWPG